jgi:HemK-related putative methylase
MMPGRGGSCAFAHLADGAIAGPLPLPRRSAPARPHRVVTIGRGSIATMAFGLRLLIRGPLKLLVRRLTRSRSVASRLFGVRVRPLPDRSLYYFDVTTLVLRDVASRHIKTDTRVLDLGTGAAAIIGLSLWRRHGCPVISADVNPTLVLSARDNVAFNGAPIDVVQSSFFDGVPCEFDLVTFNPPYVTTSHGRRRGLADEYRIQWDGGPEGTSVIRRFLDEVARHGARPLVLMGVNRWHATPDRIDALFRERPRLRLVDVIEHRYLPVNVYVFQRAD